MNIDLKRKLPAPEEIKEMYPLNEAAAEIIKMKRSEIRQVLSGKDDRMILIIGPCSADNEDSVLDYISRLAKIEDKVRDKLILVPRIYTSKSRTIGTDYKGIVHQPDPSSSPDLLKGLIETRLLHIRAVNEFGMACTDEMLYPENYTYLDDILCYVTVGARSVENQQHRLVASALDCPVGMKNPTSGDLSVMMGITHPNYNYETVRLMIELYEKWNLKNPALIIDCNHANSGKKALEQPRILKEVLHYRSHNEDIAKLIKGFMVESYIEDGNQAPGGSVYGQSITDPCIGWEKSEKLILETAQLI